MANHNKQCNTMHCFRGVDINDKKYILIVNILAILHVLQGKR